MNLRNIAVDQAWSMTDWYVTFTAFNFSPKLATYQQSTCGAKSNTNKNTNILRFPKKKPWVTWINIKRNQNFLPRKSHPVSIDVAPCFIYDHLFKTIIQNVFTDPQIQVFQENKMSSHIIQTQITLSACPFAPLTLTAFSHGTTCNYFHVHVMQDAEDVRYFFFIHDCPHLLMSLCKHVDKPSLHESFEPQLCDKFTNFN